MAAYMPFSVMAAVLIAACAQRASSPPATAPEKALASQRENPWDTGPPHPDYALLRPFRNYYRLLSVGPFVHHLRTYSVHRELVADDYMVSIDGSRVLHVGDEYGFSGPFADEYPPSAAAIVERVTRDLRARGDRRDISVHYLGAYREIALEEIVPSDDPGKADARRAASAAAKFQANEDLSQWLGRVTEGMSVGHGPQQPLCWTVTRDCHPPPRWLDARADRDGTSRLWVMFDPRSFVDPEVRKRFGAAGLAAARALVEGRPSIPLSDLAVQREPGLLSPSADDTIRFGLQVDAWPEGSSLRQAVATIPFSLRDALREELHGAVELFVEGGSFSLRANVRAEVPAGEHRGVEGVHLWVEFWLSTPAYAAHNTAAFVLNAVLDGDRAMPLGRAEPDPEWLRAHPGELQREFKWDAVRPRLRCRVAVGFFL